MRAQQARKRLTLTLMKKRQARKRAIQTVSAEVKTRSVVSDKQRSAVSGRCMGLNRKTGKYRADEALKSFSWQTEPDNG